MDCFASFREVHILSSCNQNTSGTSWINLSLRIAEVIIIIIIIIPLSLFIVAMACSVFAAETRLQPIVAADLCATWGAASGSGEAVSPLPFSDKSLRIKCL